MIYTVYSIVMLELHFDEGQSAESLKLFGALKFAILSRSGDVRRLVAFIFSKGFDHDKKALEALELFSDTVFEGAGKVTVYKSGLVITLFESMSCRRNDKLAKDQPSDVGVRKEMLRQLTETVEDRMKELQ